MNFALNDLVEIEGWEKEIGENWIIIEFASNNSEAVLLQIPSGNQTIVEIGKLKHQNKVLMPELVNIIDSPIQKTWQAQIYCGLRKGYSQEVFSIEEIKRICQNFVDEIGWCVTVTPTEFIYKQGNEPGAIIGVIQYPRFPLHEKELENRTLKLAEKLLFGLEQYRLTICFPNETLMLESESI